MTALAAPLVAPARSGGWTLDRPLLLIGALALGLRIIASLMLQHPLASDALSYFTMARNLAEQGVLLDNFGLRAFYSVGYPLILTPFFALFGSSVGTALAVNLLLGLVTLGLIHRIAHLLSGRMLVARIATLGYALWLPAIWNATMLAKENLSTPLLLGLLLCALHVARGARPITAAAIGGLLWGASLLTGGSALLLCAGMGVALILLWRQATFGAAIRAGLGFMAGAMLLVGPWLVTTDRLLGTPVLTTNAAFNLYLGNNPAATGRFVSISDTPEGDGWIARRHALGEMGTTHRLQAAATAWMMAHPADVLRLAGLKLAYFWDPNIPDAADFAASRVVAGIQAINVVQFGVILILGLWAIVRAPLRAGDRWVLAATIVGFWVIHAAAYIIVRYRDPVMPVLIILMAFPAATMFTRLTGGKGARDAA